MTAQVQNDQLFEGLALVGMGTAFHGMGDDGRARSHYESALANFETLPHLAGFEALPHHFVMAQALSALALVLEEEGFSVQALPLMKQCLEVERMLGSPEAEQHGQYLKLREQSSASS